MTLRSCASCFKLLVGQAGRSPHDLRAGLRKAKPTALSSIEHCSMCTWVHPSGGGACRTPWAAVPSEKRCSLPPMGAQGAHLGQAAADTKLLRPQVLGAARFRLLIRKGGSPGGGTTNTALPHPGLPSQHPNTPHTPLLGPAEQPAGSSSVLQLLTGAPSGTGTGPGALLRGRGGSTPAGSVRGARGRPSPGGPRSWTAGGRPARPGPRGLGAPQPPGPGPFPTGEAGGSPQPPGPGPGGCPERPLEAGGGAARPPPPPNPPRCLHTRAGAGRPGWGSEPRWGLVGASEAPSG